MRCAWWGAEVVGEARDAADLSADGLVGAVVIEGAIDDVTLDLILGDGIPFEIDVPFVAFRGEVLRWRRNL